MSADQSDGPSPAGEDRGGPGHRRSWSPEFLLALTTRPREMKRMVERLHRRVHDDTTLRNLLHRASEEAVRMIVGADWAGVTTQFAGPPVTAAHSDPRVLTVDDVQYELGDGPCLRAMRTDRAVTMTGPQVTQRWPILRSAVHRVGVQAFHAEPLHARGLTVGSLNLYSAQPGGLHEPDRDVLVVLTECLDRGLTDYSAAQAGEKDARRLQHALRTHLLVNHAVGVLMASHELSVGAARRALNQDAVAQGRPIAEVAVEIIGNHGTPGRAPRHFGE